MPRRPYSSASSPGRAGSCWGPLSQPRPGGRSPPQGKGARPAPAREAAGSADQRPALAPDPRAARGPESRFGHPEIPHCHGGDVGSIHHARSRPGSRAGPHGPGCPPCFPARGAGLPPLLPAAPQLRRLGLPAPCAASSAQPCPLTRVPAAAVAPAVLALPARSPARSRPGAADASTWLMGESAPRQGAENGGGLSSAAPPPPGQPAGLPGRSHPTPLTVASPT